VSRRHDGPPAGADDDGDDAKTCIGCAKAKVRQRVRCTCSALHLHWGKVVRVWLQWLDRETLNIAHLAL
jgi:hypothetical protein